MMPLAHDELVVVFDLDGTLVDSRGEIASAVNHVRRELGRGPLTPSEVMSYVGDGARLLLSRALQRTPDDPSLDPVLERFMDVYVARSKTESKLMPGAAEVLDALAHRRLAVCTNKPRRVTDALLEALGLERRFACVVAGGDTTHHKPHPEPLEHVARALGVSTEDLVMVGDGPQDIACAHAARARSIGVTGGFNSAASVALSQPTVLVATLSEVPRALERWVLERRGE
jgi:phosphoglycolate phosphatase